MKKSFFYLSMVIVAVFTAISLTSCGEEVALGENPVSPKEELTVFSTVSDGTRTTIDNGAVFYWQSKNVNNVLTNDQIWIDEAGTGASFSLQSSSSQFENYNRKGKFYFRKALSAASYKLSYTGFGSTTGDEVTIAEEQVQEDDWDNAEHIGTSGDCATATATKGADGNYTFKLEHRASYLIFQPYVPASTDANPYFLTGIEIVDTEGNALAGTFPLKYDGLKTDGATNTSNQVRVTCGTGFQLPTTASKSVYAVILPRGAADGGRALQARYHINTAGNVNYIVVQDISDKYEANVARLIRNDLSMPAFPTEATFTSDGNGLFGGTRFKPGYLWRTTTSSINSQYLKYETDPFFPLGSTNAYQYFFTWDELVGYFTSVTNPSSFTSDITNRRVTIDGTVYKLPAQEQYAKLTETPNSGRATVNYYPASFAAVLVDLSADATYNNKGYDWTLDYNASFRRTSHIAGYLFFPDESFILDQKLLVSSLNIRLTNTNEVSNLTADELRNYVNHGCMFLPARGAYFNGIGWRLEGRSGYYWTGNIWPNNSDAIQFSFNREQFYVSTGNRAGARYLVVLVENLP